MIGTPLPQPASRMRDWAGSVAATASASETPAVAPRSVEYQSAIRSYASIFRTFAFVHDQTVGVPQWCMIWGIMLRRSTARVVARSLRLPGVEPLAGRAVRVRNGLRGDELYLPDTCDDVEHGTCVPSRAVSRASLHQPARIRCHAWEALRSHMRLHGWSTHIARAFMSGRVTPDLRHAPGWFAVPHASNPRWLLPRDSRRVAAASLGIFQPLTVKGRIG